MKREQNKLSGRHLNVGNKFVEDRRRSLFISILRVLTATVFFPDEKPFEFFNAIISLENLTSIR